MNTFATYATAEEIIMPSFLPIFLSKHVFQKLQAGDTYSGKHGVWIHIALKKGTELSSLQDCNYCFELHILNAASVEVELGSSSVDEFDP